MLTRFSAAKDGHDHCVHELITKGVDVITIDDTGTTSLTML